ncbi:MAG: RNA polymerase sigma factor [Planctomycetota bacterium]|jgi:RNA polymerase sigma-70 factor (ECF subfamily)
MEPERLGAMIASAKAGRADGYEALLEAFGRRLYGYFLRATRSHHDAEDMLGELMLRLVRTLRDYDERGRFEPWLFRIAANLVRDRIRRKKARLAPLSLSAETDAGEAMADRLAGEPQAVDAEILAAEASARLDAALEKLDITTREMILLRHFGQLSFKEISELLDKPLGTVLARVHRGLKTLRRLMGVEDEES